MKHPIIKYILTILENNPYNKNPTLCIINAGKISLKYSKNIVDNSSMSNIERIVPNTLPINS